MAFYELMKTNNVLNDWRIQIYFQFFHSNGDLIFVSILVLIIAVTHRELHLVRERLKQELILHANFLIELILHHLEDCVGLDELENAVF